MQIQLPNALGAIEPVGGAPPVSVDASDLEPIRREALQLLQPSRERAIAVCMVSGALLIGVSLGWVGCLVWKSATVVAAAPTTRATPVRHAETKSASRPESIRKQAPSVTASINVSRPSASVSRTEVDGPKMAAAILGLPSEPRPPLAPAPETRPTTIEGWTVLDVRGQTAVLQGPDGVRTVSLGESVPGIGRVDSIVRWGNRWIVATASGLIATP
jgi:hypothetical protein